MNNCEYFSWLSFLQQLVSGIGIGAIVSLSISLNIRVQNKYKSDPTVFTNFIQGLAYVVSMAMVIPSVIYIGSSASVAASSFFESAIFILGAILTVVMAFRSGFIPNDLTRGANENDKNKL